MNIGLFPLNTIIFPGSALPLHIYEERYKILINQCWRNKEQFGINLSSKGKLFDVGCMVDVVDIMKRYEDGKLDIIVVGIRRFKMRNFISGEKPYYIANVDYYNDISTEFDQSLLMKTIRLFNRIADGITTTVIKKITIEELDKKTPSFQLALKSGLTIEQKQIFIELRSEKERLEMVFKHLRTLNMIVEEADLVNKIVKNDGYFNLNELEL